MVDYSSCTVVILQQAPHKPRPPTTPVVYSLIPELPALTHVTILMLTCSGSSHFTSYDTFHFVQNSVPHLGPTCLSGVLNLHTSATIQLLHLTSVSLDTQPSYLAGLHLNSWVDALTQLVPPAPIWACVYFQIPFEKSKQGVPWCPVARNSCFHQ